MAVVAPPLPWAMLPDIAGANIYRYPPAGAIAVPAIVYRADEPWIERRASFRVWVENYVAVCIVSEAAGGDAVQQLYDLALAVKTAIDGDRALDAWEWKGAGGIVETDQAGMKYLACAVRLSFTAEYD